MLSPPLMFILLHPLLNLRVWGERKRNFSNHQPFGEPTLEVESFADISRDENEVVTLRFEELVKSDGSPLTVRVMGDDAVAESFFFESSDYRFSDGVSVWENHPTLVLVPSHDGRYRFDLPLDACIPTGV